MRHWQNGCRALCVAGLLLAGAAQAMAQGPDLPANGLIVQLKETTQRSREFALSVPEEAAVRREGAARTLSLAQAAGVPAVRTRPVGRAAQHLDFGRVLSAKEAALLAEKLRAQPDVAWAEPNERQRLLDVPFDPRFAATAQSTGQWWMFPVSGSNGNAAVDRRRGVPGLQSAWDTTVGNGEARVAVLDTGTVAHPDLSAHVLPGYDFVSAAEYANDGGGRDADPSDPGDWVSQQDKDQHAALYGKCNVRPSTWHGTIIAGIIAALTDNGVGVAGINWDARVVPVRVAGKCGADLADIIDGMRWAAGLQVLDANGDALPINQNPVRVVNISFGGSAACGNAYQSAINELAGHGVVVVAAAGNENGKVTRPASCSGVVAVAALNRDGFKATYSNFGPSITVATVGGDPQRVGGGAWDGVLDDDGLLTLGNSGTQSPGSSSYVNVSGSSFSTPVTAGVISLMLSVNPSLGVAQIIDGLKLSARPHVTSPKIEACSWQNPGRCICTTSTCGAGILDADQAVRYALAPATYVPPSSTPAVIDNDDVDRAVALGNDLPPNDPAAENTAANGESGSGGGGGGGASSGVTLAALALAVLWLAWGRVGTGRTVRD